MKDQIEDFISKNKKDFDDKQPSDRNWSIIEASLKTSSDTRWWNSLMLWRVAAVLFMAFSIYLLIPKTSRVMQRESSLKDFTDVEAFYIQEISEKTQLIDEFQRQEGLNGFTQDFKQLEAMYMVLREEMKNRPSQKVKDALVLNLLVRIDLLNQQLHKLEKEYKSDDAVKPSKNI